jgi:hypothetical protein
VGTRREDGAPAGYLSTLNRGSVRARLSAGRNLQLLQSIMPLWNQRLFGFRKKEPRHVQITVFWAYCAQPSASNKRLGTEDYYSVLPTPLLPSEL